MLIHSLAFRNTLQEWELKSVNFNRLTLLVGVSGVGKTRVLDSLLTLKRIAQGYSVEGVAWDLAFSADDTDYRWSGEFDATCVHGCWENGDDITTKARLREETLTRDGKTIVARTDGHIELNGATMPKLSPYASVLHILSHEDDILPAHSGFTHIFFTDHTAHSRGFRLPPTYFERLAKQYATLDRITESGLPPYAKLALAMRHAPDTFAKIKRRFMDVFPSVLDVRFHMPEEPDFGSANDRLVLQIREAQVTRWIDQDKLSAGMFRTLMHIAEILLSPDGAVFLIDEFENSLGVNCIDFLTEDIVRESEAKQFIITSHHPYIINNIGMEFWKIVTRRGGTVEARDAVELIPARSRHDAFMQLINLDEYLRGIETP